MDQTKNSDKVILNNENYNNQQSKIIQNKNENEKEDDNEIIIELEIANDEKLSDSDDEIYNSESHESEDHEVYACSE